MRILVASIIHESNTFSGVRTDLDDFDISLGQEIIECYRNTEHEVSGFVRILTSQEANIVPAILAHACPSGKVTDRAFQTLVDRLIKNLKKALPLDGILLALHGAMVTESIDDPEGFLLKTVRDNVGKDVPIVSTLDCHANVSEAMVTHSNVLVAYKTAPHVDQRETGKRAANVILSLIRNNIKASTRMKKIPMLLSGDAADTNLQPMKRVIKEAIEAERKDGVISVSVCMGFPWADIKNPTPTPSVAVATNDNPNLAETIAIKLANLFWKFRNDFSLTLVPVSKAVEEAISSKDKPIIISDTGDNPSGGASGDVNVLLQALIEKGGEINAALGVIVDPQAVEEAISKGIGNRITISIGGKIDQSNSKPISVNGIVKLISNGKYVYKAPLLKGVEADMGRTVVLSIRNIDVVVTEKPAFASDPQLFRSVGIEPCDRKILVLKDVLQFRSAYQSIAKKIIFAKTPGWTHQDFSALVYKNIQRPLFPLNQF